MGAYWNNRCGDRQLNSALWRITMVRLATDDGTRAYLERRVSEGKTKIEAVRCIKRYLARDTATGALDALRLPGSYATRLASQRRLMLVLADEITATEVELHRRLRGHPGYRKPAHRQGHRAGAGCDLRRRDR